MCMPCSHTHKHTPTNTHYTHTHACMQALDESHSESNEGISVDTELEEDPVLLTLLKKDSLIEATHTSF